jgi:hypothetical protein
MADVMLVPDGRGFVFAALRGLLQQGWRVARIPADGRLRHNQQILELEYGGTRDRFRLLIFKVGQSGRSRPHERRIEITSTYAGGRLTAEPETTDVLLGYEPDEDVFVGFDSRRLSHGGLTENASAFIDVEGLRLASDIEVAVLPRESDLFGFEHHAFFRPPRIGEYLTNRGLIHAGVYTGGGPFSGTFRASRLGAVRVPEARAIDRAVVLKEPASSSSRRPTRAVDVEAVETGRAGGLRSRRMSPEQFQELLRQAEENGALGERLVLEAERRRLLRAGRADLSARVRWTSRENVLAGYDISSFEFDGTSRFIEVKSTASVTRRFVISRNEWTTAAGLRDRYWIYLVTDVRGRGEVTRLQDPIALEAAGQLHREPDGWVVTVRT